MVSGWISDYVHRAAHVLPSTLGGSNHGKKSLIVVYSLLFLVVHLLALSSVDIYS